MRGMMWSKSIFWERILHFVKDVLHVRSWESVLWVDCFERSEFSGVVFAGGVNEAGDIKGHKALKEAYQMGKSL